jgi:hypothetical protein
MGAERQRQRGEPNDMSQAARTQTILRRLPRHLGADDPGKLFMTVVDGLDGELEVKSRQLGRVRRAHALADADEEHDVLLLAGLHDLHEDAFTLLRQRLAAVRAAHATPATAPATLPDLLGLPPDAFPAWPDETDASASEARLADALDVLAAYPSELDLLRSTVTSVIALHRRGNGTVTALLGAAAAYLQLELADIVDTDDRYWHVAGCNDRMRLTRPESPGSHPATTALQPQRELLALEENPLRQQDSEPVERRHGDRFHLLRSGFETVPATIRVVGVGDRTVQPMVVNLDTGFGVVFTGSVPDGQELRFESDGRVTLANASVARLSYSFTGGVYSDATQSDLTRDFTFAGGSGPAPTAMFAVTEPIDDGFAPDAAFPHVDGLLESASLVVGESRWAFFVREANYGRAAAAVADELAVPVFEAAVFDASVYEPVTTAGSPSSAKIGFSWQEHEPFAARLWVPLRFSTLDADGEVTLKERLRLQLDRHRAAGIHVYVEYADDRWTVPGGVLRDAGSDEPLGTVIVGTAVWPAPDMPT